MAATGSEGVLRVGSAFPDPPFEVDEARSPGFDLELMTAIGQAIGLRVEQRRYEGADFEGIFSGLDDGSYDVVASGATVTEHRKSLALWCSPYLRSGQSLVVDVGRNPRVRSVDDLTGLVLGVQRGNTSEPVARRLHATGRVADVAVYPYGGILDALDDLESGRIGAFMKLEPVMRSLTSDRPSLEVVETGITEELLAAAVARGNEALAHEIDAAQRRIAASGELASLGRRWFAASDPRATGILA